VAARFAELIARQNAALFADLGRILEKGPMNCGE
jgi:hypothetical protein